MLFARTNKPHAQWPGRERVVTDLVGWIEARLPLQPAAVATEAGA